jgi:cytochrome c oxidase subunit 3
MPHDTHGGISNPVLGMILFITSEVMFFGGLFAAYFNIRANAAQWPPEQFTETLKILPFVGPATILLILSSFTCQYAVWAIRRDDRTVFVRAMSVTVILGIVFLLMQASDYVLLGQEGLTLASGTFGTTYYTLTGFHGAHVFGGVVGISIILLRGVTGQFSAKHHVAVEAVSAYWHFVDVVWIFLFATLYFLK